jgi:hypothetical protein
VTLNNVSESDNEDDDDDDENDMLVGEGTMSFYSLNIS